MGKNPRHMKPSCSPYYIGWCTTYGAEIRYRDPEAGADELVWEEGKDYYPDEACRAWGIGGLAPVVEAALKAMCRHARLWDGHVGHDWNALAELLLKFIGDAWTLTRAEVAQDYHESCTSGPTARGPVAPGSN